MRQYRHGCAVCVCMCVGSHMNYDVQIVQYIYMHPRQLIFLRKSNCLGCAVLLCLVVCLTLLASFFLPSHLSLKHVYMYFKINRHRDETTQQFSPSLLTNQLSHCVQCHHGNKHRQLQQKVEEDGRPRVERESAHGRHHRNCSEKEGGRLGEPSEK